MISKFKNTLIGKRIILKRIKPTIEFAQIIYDTVNANREHLEPWLSWVKYTKHPEDSLRYLFEKKEQTDLGKFVEYGIFLKNNYIGNIAIFDINPKDKSAEIGYWLSFEHTKKGYMSEAIKIIEDEFFKNFDINRIQIKCDEDNFASSGVAKKCGYKFEGLHREDFFSEHTNYLKNTLFFSKLKSDWKKQNNS